MQVPEEDAAAVTALVLQSLERAAGRWAAGVGRTVRGRGPRRPALVGRQGLTGFAIWVGPEADGEDGNMKPMKAFETVTAIENAVPLDRVVRPLRNTVARTIGSGPAGDALRGDWLGHPLHPVAVQLPTGAFMSASLLDAMPRLDPQGRAARALIAVGLLTAGPAAASGLADWAGMHEQMQRVGVVHAAANTVALALYAGSLAARVTGNASRGRTLAVAGLSVLGAGGFLGGHLAFRQAAG